MTVGSSITDSVSDDCSDPTPEGLSHEEYYRTIFEHENAVLIVDRETEAFLEVDPAPCGGTVVFGR